MIEMKSNVKDSIKNFNDSNTYILTDFDRTITSGNSDSSWSILSKSKFVSKEYIEERKKLYDYYRPIEINENLDFESKNNLMIEWWNKHISLFIKYKLKKEVIEDSAKNLRVMSFRKGAKEFLESLNKRNIPVVIISAGIGNFIEQFLIKNDCYLPNIHIAANFIEFKDGIAVGISGNIIHSLNKNAVSYSLEIKKKLENRSNVILLGDSLSDIKMLGDDKKREALKIGFLEENVVENKQYFAKEFDIVCTDDTNYFELNKELEKISYKLI